MSEKTTKKTKTEISLENQVKKLQSQVKQLKAQLDSKRDAIVKKNEKLRKFREKEIYVLQSRKIAQLENQIEQLKTTIVKRQESGCYECKKTEPRHRIVSFSNLSICLECIHDAENLHFRGQKNEVWKNV